LKVYFALLWSPVTVALVAGASTVTGGCASLPRYGVISYLVASVAPFFSEGFHTTTALWLPLDTDSIAGAPGASVGVVDFGFVVDVGGFVVGVLGGAD
jgi:hypothetical protein